VDDIIKTFHFAVFFQTTTFEMVWLLKGPLKYDEWIHEEIQPSFLSGCRNLDVAAHGYAVMIT
jgi:hypothetical protein